MLRSNARPEIPHPKTAAQINSTRTCGSGDPGTERNWTQLLWLCDKLRQSPWQGTCLVAITYVYFLIFAQFAFIHRLTFLGIAGPRLKVVMAAMAIGGSLLSLLAPRLAVWSAARTRLQIAFALSATAAFLSLMPLGLASAMIVAALIGAGLGILTVTLATHLRQFTGSRNALFKVGLGTGIAYLFCNIPSFFTARPQAQAAVSGMLCLAGIVAARLDHEAQPESDEPAPSSSLPFAIVVASFAALVWLDSAAFFIIQNTASLKAGTWQGTSQLWANGLWHLAAALGSAWLLSRRGLAMTLSASVATLASACLLLPDPSRALPASILYPIGVSLYSVALVAYPSLLSAATSSAERARQAGWIYAIAGWLASALGIGMGQNLGHVPTVFVIAACTVVLLPSLIRTIRTRSRELALVGTLLFVAFVLYRMQPSAPAASSLSPVDRGRLVYLSEGCINCHSQYVRPNTTDVLMWGPVESLDSLHRERPPLIGNRRQGPDLSQVGVRRSPLWLKMHLFNPREVSGASIMPAYPLLFQDERGDDLVAYLSSLRGPAAEQHIADEEQWQLPADIVAEADAVEGQHLYSRFCAACHTPNGHTRIAWQSDFVEQPAILAAGTLRVAQSASASSSRFNHLARIIKFGIPDSDMAGHEYLSDKDIASLTLWLAQNATESVPHSSTQTSTGENE
jgi:cbb3-type cytochrome c oxidase subunit II